MMGFGEEVGVTPRFCEELFARLPKDQNKEVSLLTINECYYYSLGFKGVYHFDLHRMF